MTIKAIDSAVEIVGSMRALAEKLSITKGAITHWKNSGGNVPAEHCPSIERMTNRRVRCEQLNSTIDWAYIRSTNAPSSSSTQA